MPVDNHLYDTLADSWWDESGVLNTLQGLNPVRFGYMRRILIDELGMDLRGKKTLDVGCGGGLLAEEFARLGCMVTGIDPSEKSLESARDHARQEGLAIEYRQGVGEDLPFPDGAFEIVYCCDTLEHVDNLGKVIGQISRVLKPGGVFLYDTINRTLESWIVMIKLFQEWDSTSLMPPDLHDWKMFIKPGELLAKLAENGLENQDQTGLKSSVNPLRAIRILRARKRGEISYLEAMRRIDLREGGDKSVLYAGYAVKPIASKI
jgi:2-polyprenyl-6-hydroxyphenyl methylase / 3-demethylubiquinone-9 3-methyltransferase